MPKTFIFQQAKIPAYASAFGKRLAKHLWDFRLYLGDHRKEREQYVRECDDAYLAKQYVPDTGGIELLETGEFGESDPHDYAQTISSRAALAIMSGNWVKAGTRADDGPGAVQALQDYNLYLHHKGKARRQFQRVIKHGWVRGTMALHYDWQDRYRLRRITPTEHAVEIENYLRKNGLPQKDAKNFTRGRQKELIFSGPVISPIDFYDLWIEPYVDIVAEGRRPATILQRFRSKASLLAERDDFDKFVYKNLEEVEEWNLNELLANREFMGNRLASERIFGNSATASQESTAKLVPVYTFYFPYLEFEGQQFWDTYFHVALSSKGAKPHIILIEENPNDLGINNLLIDHYEDWFTPTPYGISPLQFMLSKYHQKNLLQLLFITAAAHSVFPPNLLYQPGFRDEEEISFFPGHSISVMENILGLDVVKPLTMPNNGAMLGENVLRFMADELRAIAGVEGLITDNAARSASARKTATEINRDVGSGSASLDNLAANLREGLLTDYVQGVFQLSQVRAIPSGEREDCIDYEKYLGDEVIQKQLEISDLQKKRSMQVLGTDGVEVKEQRTANLLKLFETAGQIQDPRMNGLRMFLALNLATELNVPIPQEFKMSPEEAVAQNPEVQIAALQAALQNPEIQQMIIQQVQQAVGQGQPLPQEQPTNAPQFN